MWSPKSVVGFRVRDDDYDDNRVDTQGCKPPCPFTLITHSHLFVYVHMHTHVHVFTYVLTHSVVPSSCSFFYLPLVVSLHPTCPVVFSGCLSSRYVSLRPVQPCLSGCLSRVRPAVSFWHCLVFLSLMYVGLRLRLLLRLLQPFYVNILAFFCQF